MGLIYFLLVISLALPCLADMDNEPHDIILRAPATETQDQDRDRLLEITARIDYMIDAKSFSAVSRYSEWSVGELVAVESQSPAVGIIAFVEVTSIENKQDGTYALKFELVRQSRINFVQVGDTVFKLDLSSDNRRYKGTTDLMIRRRSDKISSRYKPLITQGVNIGDTAQTLWAKEYLITWYGLIDYGITDRAMVSTAVPLDLAGGPNLQFKYKFFESDSNVLSSGFSFAKIPNEKRSTLNFNFLWDGISSESQINHTYLTIALFTFDQAKDATAIQSLGTTSFQTGYEFVLDNWDRFLVGPNYNFEKKTLGGYLSYVMIWDKFHLALSANSTNISSLRLSAQNGYYFFFDAYWRF
jgi:hypothetical protein